MTDPTICATCGTAITEADVTPCDTSECPIPMPSKVEAKPPIVRGTFTTLEVPPIAAAKTAHFNPIAKAHEALINELAFVAIPRIHVTPEAEEFEDVADYLLRTAAMFDRWLKMVGEEVQANALTRIDMNDFEGRFVGALEGNATFELDRCAQAVREERADYVADTDYRVSVARAMGAMAR